MKPIAMPTGCEFVEIGELVPYAKNPKEHTDKDVDLIIKSIQRNGWGDPILVCPETNEILSGNGRYLAAKKIGLEMLPVVYAPDGLTEKQKADLVIASNKLVEVSGYNDNLGDLIINFELNTSDFGIETPEFYMKQEGQAVNFDDIVENAKKEKICPNCGYKIK